MLSQVAAWIDDVDALLFGSGADLPVYLRFASGGKRLHLVAFLSPRTLPVIGLRQDLI